MEKLFYCVWHEPTNTFLTEYTDGEGNDYYRFVEFKDIALGGIYCDEIRAVDSLRFAKNNIYNKFVSLDSNQLSQCVVCPVNIHVYVQS